MVPVASLKIDLVFRIDDATAGIAIHAIGSIIGLISAGLFIPSPTWLDKFKLLAVQGAGIAMVAALTIASSVVMFLTIQKLVGLRVKEADEFDGLDLAEHDIGAYPDFQQTTIKSYHLREA